MTDREKAMAYPLLIGPDNAIAVTGVPWRRVRDNAILLGIPTVRLGRTTLIPASEFLAALVKAGPVADTEITSTEDAAELVRRSIGKKRRAL